MLRSSSATRILNVEFVILPSFPFGHLGRRQGKPKHAALAALAFHADISAMATDNFSGDIESQTGAFRTRARNLEKFFKNPFLKLFRNTFAGVCDGESDHAVDFFSVKSDAAVTRRVTDRIADEIGKDMVDTHRIGADFDFR